MQKIQFSDGSKTSSAKVTIDGVDYPVTPARYTGATPLSSVVMNAMQTNIENAINQNTDNIGGEDYDETSTYLTGDIVKYEGQLYIANQDIDTAEEWDSTKWDATDVLSSAGGNEVAIGDSTTITSKTKIWINEEEGTDAYSEVVNSLSGDEIAKAPSVRAVNEGLLEVYSTEERRIGTFVDNKPLYEKTLYFTSNQYSNNTENTLSLDIDNAENIWLEKAFGRRDRGASFSPATKRYEFQTLPNVHSSLASWGLGVYDINPVTKDFKLWIGNMNNSGFILNYIYFTFRYTKTTD